MGFKLIFKKVGNFRVGNSKENFGIHIKIQ